MEGDGEFVVLIAGQELNSKSIADVTSEGGVCHYLHVISHVGQGRNVHVVFVPITF